jgi:formylglycine-generating enzyme required for sulfatase activity
MDMTKGIGRYTDSPPSVLKGKNYLLTIGIDTYDHHRPLDNAVNDATAFAEVMTNRYRFEHLHEPIYNKQATRKKILDVLSLSESLNEDDRLIVFYSGHGWYKKVSRLGYIVPMDADHNPHSDFIEVGQVINIFKGVNAKHILLIVDCCFGGSFGERDIYIEEKAKNVIADLDAKKSRWVLSSGSIEPVFDGLVIDNNSPFTKPLVEFLNDNKEEQIVFSDIFPQLRRKVRWNSIQMPQYRPLPDLGYNDGELALLVEPKIEPLGDYLRNIDYEMVLVKGGTFIREFECEEYIEKEVRTGIFGLSSKKISSKIKKNASSKVTLSDFVICKYPVTQTQWIDVMGYNPSHFQGNNLPVENVDWKEVQVFIQTLNHKLGKKFRLPTEAEWEFAARGGNESKGYKYSGSDDINEVAWHIGNSHRRIYPVGIKKANELGIYDMSGNIWEWCEDYYGSYNNLDENNPLGIFPADRYLYVRRGGSFANKADFCLVDKRSSRSSGHKHRNLGFRLVHPIE